ncbi:hypothetical protein M5689_000258 [Euphorbia peplus]|nr:hypothetical protein M5689_000258 [Euphorbia peplus]
MMWHHALITLHHAASSFQNEKKESVFSHVMPLNCVDFILLFVWTWSSSSLEVDDEDHVHFLWMLLSNYIFEPLRSRPTVEILEIAKALPSRRPMALGTMLLAHTFHRLSLTVTEKPFNQPRGGLWLFQLGYLHIFLPWLRGHLTEGLILSELIYARAFLICQ